MRIDSGSDAAMAYLENFQPTKKKLGYEAYGHICELTTLLTVTIKIWLD